MRWTARLLKAIGILLIAIGILAIVVVLASRTERFRTFLRDTAERQASRFLNGSLSVGRIDGNLVTGAVLKDVRLMQDGREIVAADEVRLSYKSWELVRGDLLFRDLTVTRPRVLLIHDGTRWRITSLLRLPERRGEGGRAVRMPGMEVRQGTITFERADASGPVRFPARITGFDADLSLTLAAAGATDVDIDRATFTAEDPALTVPSLSGRWTTRQGRHYVQNLHLRTARSAVDGSFTYLPAVRAGETATLASNVSLTPFDFEEFTGLVPGLARRPLSLSGTISAAGPMDRLRLDTTLSDARAGRVRANILVDAVAPARSFRGSVAVAALDLSLPLADRQLASRLTADTTIDLGMDGNPSFEQLTGTAKVRSASSRIWGYEWQSASSLVRFRSGTLQVDGRASAYGAAATARGTISPTARPVRYQLAGHVADVDMRRLPRQLPLPRLQSDLAGNYKVSGTGTRLDASMVFDPSTVEGTNIGPASVGRFANTGGETRYGFDGRVDHANVEGWGNVLDIEALKRDTYASDLNGQLSVDGRGTTLETLVLDAKASLESSTAFKASFERADVTARIENQTLTTSAQGQATNLNPTVLGGLETLDSSMSGRFDVMATIPRLGEPFMLDAIDAAGTVDVVDSFVGPLDITKGRLEARMSGGQAQVAAFDAQGPQMTVTAKGAVALADGGQSNLTYTATLFDLATISPLVGRTLAGRAQMEGTLAGTSTDPTVAATATLSSVKVDTVFDALAVDASFDGRIPNRDLNAFTGTLKTNSTLVTLAGRDLPRLMVALDKAGDDIQFQIEASESGRAVGGEGLVTLFPTYRDVRVNRLSIEAGTSRWVLPEGTAMLARYEPSGLVTFSNGFTLTNGPQQIAAQGSLSFSKDVPGMLTVRGTQLQLGDVGNLLLVQRSLGGTLDTAAEIGGTSEARTIAGQFNLVDGLVGEYKFDSLQAKVDYAASKAAVDARLIQSPGNQLDAHGLIPVSVERGELTDDPLMLDVLSQGIDLAVLAAATDQLQNVSGRLTLDVHVRGTGAAPEAEGIVAVQQGAFTVTATGSPYTGVEMTANLDGNDVRIAQFRMLDDDMHTLEGSGSMHLEQRAVRDIDFTLTATDFEVLDNELGELAVDSTLNVFGTVLAPKVAGLVQVRAGRLEVDALLDRFTTNAYRIDPEPLSGRATAGAQREESPAIQVTGLSQPDAIVPAAFAPAVELPEAPAAETPNNSIAKPIEFNLTVQIPDNLVLRGRDIRTSGSPVGLGDINITAGGHFTFKREGEADAVLIGEVNTVRGTYDFQGRRFEVLRDGRIVFRGTQPIDPALDVTAEREISGIVASVNITGTARSPKVTLSSQPPLEESDVFSLIVFNQPVNRLGQGEVSNLAERAAGMASGFVVTPLAVSLERALDLDLLELDAVGDERGGPSATIGRQVGEKLFVKFRQSFGTQDVSEFELEYQIADFLRLEGSVAQGRNAANRSLTRRVERGGIDLVVFFSY
jgi:autotransporter translocation and assembly factor TamB